MNSGNTITQSQTEESAYYDLIRKFTGNRVKSNYFLKMQTTLENSCFTLGEKNPYFHYFLSKEDEKKENLIIMLENINNNRILIATGLFFGYNITKGILWRYGYFAYFFYHTRFMSFAVYLCSLYLIKNHFEANLIRNNLFRYYEKRNAYKKSEENIKIMITRENLLNNKKF